MGHREQQAQSQVGVAEVMTQAQEAARQPGSQLAGSGGLSHCRQAHQQRASAGHCCAWRHDNCLAKPPA